MYTVVDETMLRHFAKNENTWYRLEHVCTTDMSLLLNEQEKFNGNISTWDTSIVTNMSSMFYNANDFNGDLSNWDTSSVTNMNDLFRSATAFNQNISNWNTTSVTNMGSIIHWRYWQVEHWQLEHLISNRYG